MSRTRRPGPDPPNHYILWCPPSRSCPDPLPGLASPPAPPDPIRSPVSQMLPIRGDLVNLPGGGGKWRRVGGWVRRRVSVGRAPDRVSWSPLPWGRGPWGFGVMSCGGEGAFLIICGAWAGGVIVLGGSLPYIGGAAGGRFMICWLFSVLSLDFVSGLCYYYIGEPL